MSTEDLPEVEWHSGTAGISQTCDTVCAEAACGEDRDQVCSEPATCLSEWLSVFWLDASCALHAEARAANGLPAYSTCSQCSPADYCASSSCMFCAPGALLPTATAAYYGTSVSSPNPCSNQYLDARTTPLCPCLLPPGGAVGWTLTIAICCSLGIYIGAGVGYGRHKNPPAEGSGALSNPDGLGVAGWHPHYNAWGELQQLVREGARYSWFMINSKGGGDKGYDPLQEEIDDAYYSSLAKRLNPKGVAAGGAGDDEEEGLVAPSSSEKGKKPRRKSEAVVKKKKKKKKPRPSLPIIERGDAEAAGGGAPLE